MMGGYLARVAESGMTSMRDVRSSIPGTQVERNSQEQSLAAPFTRDEREDTVSDPTHAWLEPRSEARVDPRNQAVGLPQDTTVQPDIASYNAPAMDTPPLAPPAVAAAFPTRPPDTRIEERWSRETVSAMPPEARHTGAAARSLKDAGIRSVRGGLPGDEVPTASGANRQRAVTFDVTVQPLDRAADDDEVQHQRVVSQPDRSSPGDGEESSRPSGVSATRVEQWRRLKDRLLLEHYPGTSNSTASFESADSVASHPTNVSSTSREIVIEQLEVVVAAPHPTSPPPVAGPSSRPPRTGAWSVATRRYLGKL